MSLAAPTTSAAKSLCPAKVNLFLKVLGKRPDGYHEISTLMQPVSLYDELTVEIADGAGIELICPSDQTLSNQSNLAYRAAELFLKNTGIKTSRPMCCHLKKYLILKKRLRKLLYVPRW